MKLALALMLFYPLLGALINMLAGPHLSRRACQWVACGAVWLSFVDALAAFLCSSGAPFATELFRWMSAFDFNAPVALYYDSLAAVLCLMVTFVAGTIHLYATGYMAEDRDYVRFFVLLNLFVFAMLLLLLADSLPLLFLGWEGVGFCSYGLIGFWYREEANATAGRKAFIVTRIGDVAFGVAIFWLFSLFGTTLISEINTMGNIIPVGTVTILGLLLLGGAIGKSAQVPLMVWLPDAMAGPTPVSALIHAATMVIAGVYLLGRFLPFLAWSPAVPAVIACIGGLTAFFAATCALAQTDLKRLLAYSTMSQIGFMMLGVGSGAVVAATFHLLVHAFFKALLFMGAGAVIAHAGHEQDIFRMGGLRRTLPRTFWPFLVGAACLAGFPLTGGFFSKDAILLAVYLQGGVVYRVLLVLAEFTALLTAVYTFRMVYVVFGGEPGRAAHHPVPRIMENTLPPLAVLALFGGLLDLPGYVGEGGWLSHFLAPAAGPAAHATGWLELVMQLVAAILALAGLGIAHFGYGGERWRGLSFPGQWREFFREGWYIDRLYDFLLVRPYEALSRILWRQIDEGLLDRVAEGLARMLGDAGRRLGAFSSGRISLYLTGYVIGVGALLFYFGVVFF